MIKRTKTLLAVLVAVICMTATVRADANYAITLSNGINNAVFTLTYTGEVTGLQLTSPEGYVFNEGNCGAAYKKSEGKIQIGVAYAEAGKWQVLVTGSPDDGFRIMVSSNASYGDFAQGAIGPPTPTATPTPAPTPTPTSTPTVTPTPTVPSPTTAAPTTPPPTKPSPAPTQEPPTTIAPTTAEPVSTTTAPTQSQTTSETTLPTEETSDTDPTVAGVIETEPPSSSTNITQEKMTASDSQKGLSGIPVLNLIEEAVESTPWLTLPILAAGLSGALVISFIISYAITRHVQTKKYISQEWAEINYEEGEK